MTGPGHVCLKMGSAAEDFRMHGAYGADSAEKADRADEEQRNDGGGAADKGLMHETKNFSEVSDGTSMNGTGKIFCQHDFPLILLTVTVKLNSHSTIKVFKTRFLSYSSTPSEHVQNPQDRVVPSTKWITNTKWCGTKGPWDQWLSHYSG